MVYWLLLNETKCKSPLWGGRGRKFKSCHSDQVNGGCKSSVYLYFTRVFRTFGCGIFLYRTPKKCSENSEKSSWYIIWYIGSNGTFHRSVEATAKRALKTKDFPRFLGTKFSAKNAKGTQKDGKHYTKIKRNVLDPHQLRKRRGRKADQQIKNLQAIQAQPLLPKAQQRDRRLCKSL